jgi:PAS domain S-box-containing protein
MGALLRATDWSHTGLGPLELWPPALKTMASFILAHPLPLLLCWGPRYHQLYNDSFQLILGDKHPKSLGQPASECFPEVWHILGPLLDTPLRGGPATRVDDLPLERHRTRGVPQEAHYAINCSPIPDPGAVNGIGGVLATLQDVTEKVLAQRRISILRDLDLSAAQSKTALEACSAAADALARHAQDVPFAAFYLVGEDQKHARLAATAGIASEAFPPLVGAGLEDASNAWSRALADTMRSLGAGTHSEGPQPAFIGPIRSRSGERLQGLVAMGINPRLEFDDHYRDFIELAASEAAAAIENAQALERERFIRQASELTPLAIKVFDLHSERKTHLGIDALSLLGYSPNEFDNVPDYFSKLRHPGDGPSYQEYLQRLRSLADGEVLAMEYRARHKDGDWRWLSTRIMPSQRSASGQVAQVVSVTADITLRKRMDAAVQAGEERVPHLFRIRLGRYGDGFPAATFYRGECRDLQNPGL